MTRHRLLLLSALLIPVLAACGRDAPVVEPGSDAEAAVNAATPAVSGPAAPAQPATSAASPDAAVSDSVGAGHVKARDACVAAVAERSGVARERLVVTEVLWAEAGVGVTVQVPGSEAPWSCLSDEDGNVQGAASTGGVAPG
jgi:predicted small lipoprotein YifL